MKTPEKRKAIFFDRDGTLIIDKVYLNDPEQIEYLPGVEDALTKLRDAGYTFVIVTNQSGVPRGLVTIENLDEIHRRIVKKFAAVNISFAGIYYAAHSVESNHYLRKPNPGMLQTAAEDLGLDLEQSWIVGDRMSDAEAGTRAGCRSVLIEGIDTPESTGFRAPTLTVKDLGSMAAGILAAGPAQPKIEQPTA